MFVVNHRLNNTLFVLITILFTEHVLLDSEGADLKESSTETHIKVKYSTVTEE